MVLTYTWKITGLKKLNSIELNDIIIQTYWSCTGTDEDGVEGTFIGATPFAPEKVDSDNFTLYENLTEELVLNWIKDEVRDSPRNYWDHINGQIMKQINTQKASVDELREDNLPWANKGSEL